MSAAPALDEVAAIIADLIALGANAWMVIEAEAERLSVVTSFILEELEFNCHQEEMVNVGTVEALKLVAPKLPWIDAPGLRACLVLGVESLSTEQLVQLDLDRGRFADAPVIAIVTTPEGASRLAIHAPNLWSWVGSMYFQSVEPELMDVDRRIQSIRDEFGISQAELVQRAEATSLPVDPALAEWLVLIGRGDLVDG